MFLFNPLYLMKYLYFYLIFLFLILLICELILRLGLLFLNFPFLQPASVLEKKYYPEVAEISEAASAADQETKNVLILGGSVISSGWSRMESRLDTLLPLKYGEDYTYKIYNAAMAGHSSRDNLIKYQLLESVNFDLVIFYEAINEVRANNIPHEWFEDDYSHIEWYEEIKLVRSHPEINITVIPFVLHKAYNGINRIIKQRPYEEFGEVNPAYVSYGDSIKTVGPYENNLSGLIDLAQRKKEPLLFVKYVTFFPENVILTGEENNMKYFAGCQYACPVSIWGIAENVKKGVEQHNKVLARLAEQYDLEYLELDIPLQPEYFCDVCHVSEEGAIEFSSQLANYIHEKRLLN